jgi:hypothetical protein
VAGRAGGCRRRSTSGNLGIHRKQREQRPQMWLGPSADRSAVATHTIAQALRSSHAPRPHWRRSGRKPGVRAEPAPVGPNRWRLGPEFGEADGTRGLRADTRIGVAAVLRAAASHALAAVPKHKLRRARWTLPLYVAPCLLASRVASTGALAALAHLANRGTAAARAFAQRGAGESTRFWRGAERDMPGVVSLALVSVVARLSDDARRSLQHQA